MKYFLIYKFLYEIKLIDATIYEIPAVCNEKIDKST